MDITEYRLKIRANGWRPVPVTGPQTKCDNPGKAVLLKEWQRICQTANEKEIVSWAKRFPDWTNTGVLCGDVVAIDIDVTDEELANKIERLARDMLGDTPICRYGQKPKRMLFYRVDVPFHKIVGRDLFLGKLKCKVEILGISNQAAIEGGHPSGVPYQCSGDSPLEMSVSDLPTTDRTKCAQFVVDAETIMEYAKAKPANGAAPHTAPRTNGQHPPDSEAPTGWCGTDARPPRDLVLEALGYVKNEGLDYDAWIKIGYSLYAALGPEGADVWQQWSAAYPKNDPDTTAIKWRSFANVRNATHRTLFNLAWKNNWRGWPTEDREGIAPMESADAAIGADVPGLGELSAAEDEYIEPREWLLGTNFARKFVSSLLADGAVGKTTLRIAQALALASNKPITGEHIFTRCRVLIVTLEDDKDEVRRRIRAARMHHGITAADIDGWLWYAAIGSKGWKLAAHDEFRRVVVGEMLTRLEHTIRTRNIDFVVLDPFVKAHRVDENSNMEIDEVVTLLTTLAATLNIAVDIPHHLAKGAADPGNPNRGRGASSGPAAMRLVKTLTPMSTEEADLIGVSPEDRVSLVRVDNAKINLAIKTPNPQWFRLVSVALGNTTTTYPNGDHVQAIEPWEPPGKFDSLPHAKLNEILDMISAGLRNGERYSDAGAADERHVTRAFSEVTPEISTKRAAAIVRDWLKTGLLYKDDYRSSVDRKWRKGLFVNDGKRPS